MNLPILLYYDFFTLGCSSIPSLELFYGFHAFKKSREKKREHGARSREVVPVKRCSSRLKTAGCPEYRVVLLLRQAQMFGDNLPNTVFFIFNRPLIIQTVNRWLPHTTCLTCLTLALVLLVEWLPIMVAQSAGAVKYTDGISAEG